MIPTGTFVIYPDDRTIYPDKRIGRPESRIVPPEHGTISRRLELTARMMLDSFLASGDEFFEY